MKPTIFCLTPVKNEEWIIEKFLKCASIWADKIILSDQGSTDKTIEIAKKFPKVTIIDNSQLEEFNEQEMRNPLFIEARKTPGKRLLISLDADEIFTPNFDSIEWETILEAPIGTRFIFEWYNVYPDYHSVFTTVLNECGFMDDGTEYNVGLIHVTRQPIPLSPVLKIKLNSIAILHLQFVNWERMESKQMWYQMYERIYFPKKSVVSLYRTYHFDRQFIPIHNRVQLPFKDEWKQGYHKYGIDITSVRLLPAYIWDEKMIRYINKYSSKYFSKIDIWDRDWKKEALMCPDIDLKKFDDRRSWFDRLLLSYLKRTHKIRLRMLVRIIDRIIKCFV